MLANAVRELQARKAQITSQISSLTAEAKKIDQALAALTGIAGASDASPARLRALEKARAARWGKKTARRKKMSPLGKLRIKLGALNRFGKKEEAKKVAAKIAALEAQAAQK